MIPKILHTTLHEHPPENTKYFWETVLRHTAGWDHRIHQDPRDPKVWDMTSKYWNLCKNGATRANLVRLEALYKFGGIYLDSDIELIRPIDDLLNLNCFSVYLKKNHNRLANGVMGSIPEHPAIKIALEVLIETLQTNYIPPIGPSSLTKAWLGRTDVTRVDSDAFYPYLWTEMHRRNEDFSKNPNTYGVHHWNAAWN
jgi:mannosyltransferase OCH1-like enzyme